MNKAALPRSVLPDRLFNLLSPLVSKMAIHHKKGVDHAWYPEQQSQENIQDSLDRLAAKQDRQGREQDRDQVTHYGTPLMQRGFENVAIGNNSRVVELDRNQFTNKFAQLGIPIAFLIFSYMKYKQLFSENVANL